MKASEVNALADKVGRTIFLAVGDYDAIEAALREYAALLAAQEAPAQGVTCEHCGADRTKEACRMPSPLGGCGVLMGHTTGEIGRNAATPVDAQARDGELLKVKASIEAEASAVMHENGSYESSCNVWECGGRMGDYIEGLDRAVEIIDAAIAQQEQEKGK